ncbi:hypothetical protein LINPERPRIM_LOCUS675 [Linum perenne]
MRGKPLASIKYWRRCQRPLCSEYMEGNHLVELT